MDLTDTRGTTRRDNNLLTDGSHQRFGKKRSDPLGRTKRGGWQVRLRIENAIRASQGRPLLPRPKRPATGKRNSSRVDNSRRRALLHARLGTPKPTTSKAKTPRVAPTRRRIATPPPRPSQKKSSWDPPSPTSSPTMSPIRVTIKQNSSKVDNNRRKALLHARLGTPKPTAKAEEMVTNSHPPQLPVKRSSWDPPSPSSLPSIVPIRVLSSGLVVSASPWDDIPISEDTDWRLVRPSPPGRFRLSSGRVISPRPTPPRSVSLLHQKAHSSSQVANQKTLETLSSGLKVSFDAKRKRPKCRNRYRYRHNRNNNKPSPNQRGKSTNFIFKSRAEGLLPAVSTQKDKTEQGETSTPIVKLERHSKIPTCNRSVSPFSATHSDPYDSSTNDDESRIVSLPSISSLQKAAALKLPRGVETCSPAADPKACPTTPPPSSSCRKPEDPSVRSILLNHGYFEDDTTASLTSSGSGGGVDKAGRPSMIVEDGERLRTWLTAILQPLCDADPAALAKYVLALIKKDKPEKELRQSMSDQLDVFLQNETSKFIDKLFELLRTKEYLTKPPPPLVPKKEEATMPVYELSSSSSSQDSGSVASSIASRGDRESMVVDMEAGNVVGEIVAEGELANTEKDGDGSEAKINAIVKRERKDVDDRDRSRRRRSRSATRRRGGRSRSRSSRDSKKYHPRKNWRSTRRTRSRSPFRSSSAGRNRSRSPIRHRRHGSRSRSRSPKSNRSPGGTGNREKCETKDTFPRSALSIGDRLTDPGLKDGEKPSLQSVIVRAGASVEKIEKGNRCRDFDEKGLCMRGELCPFDHGTDPVVLEDVVIPGVTTASNQYSQSLTSDAYGAGNGSMLRPGMPQGMGVGEYYPDNPGMEQGWGLQFRPRMGFDPMMRGRPMLPRAMGPFPPPAHRDLINVPVMGVPTMDPLHQHPMGGMHPRLHMGRGRGRGFDHSRLGFKPARNYANCSLEVKKIPRENNNIMDLNSHFQKFGKIINIQINFEGDPEAALVTFSLPGEAQTAYRSTEAVLNNRFVRVFWHSKEKENEETSEDMIRVSAKDRLGGIEGEEMDSQEKILVSGNNITKTVYNPSLLAKKTDAAAEKIQAVEAIKKSQEMLAAQEMLKRKQEEQKTETLKIISDLRKRKQTMLDEQIQAQKKLISKLENGRSTMKQEEVNECMTLVKSIQVQIEKIKKELEEGASKAAAVPKSKEEAEREMLDAELELYNKEQEGGDTYALQQKIFDLRAKARALGVTYRGRGFRGGGRGFGGRGRGGRQVLRALRTVDRRPTRIRITGFPVARLPEILPHFSQFGTITEYETDTVTPSMILNFDSRKSSEMAVNNGKIFGESELEITWISGNAEGGESQKNGGSQEPMENGASIEEEELGDILANEILLTYEEDEEDEDGNRSWRR